jgi:hypothetical protein
MAGKNAVALALSAFADHYHPRAHNRNMSSIPVQTGIQAAKEKKEFIHLFFTFSEEI